MQNKETIDERQNKEMGIQFQEEQRSCGNKLRKMQSMIQVIIQVKK